MMGTRFYSNEAAEPQDEEFASFTISDTEHVQGTSKKHEFQAETRQLLDIVAKSLYSEKEVFIRELISNSSDALEKLRHLRVTGAPVLDDHLDLEIHLTTDEQRKTFTIQDFGIGMKEKDLIGNLGTIASSGSKKFVEILSSAGGEAAGGSAAVDNIIGQFGVGFYSAFMVGAKIDVFTRHHEPDSQGYLWTSDGCGTYDIAEAQGVARGTKVIIQLKDEDEKYSMKPVVDDIVKRYSNFVGFPIFLNGTRINTVEPMWLQSEKDVTEDDHKEFYRFISNTNDEPLYSFMYKADAPLNIRSVFYFPTEVPEVYGHGKMTGGLNLYCRKVLIQAKAEKILPEWLRFVRGVVDSEDIPLNLSREILQNSGLLRKISSILQTRILRFLQEQNRKEPEQFQQFMKTCGNYFREGLVTEESTSEKEEIAKLLLFESSRGKAGEMKTLTEYVSDMQEGQDEIYFLYAPSRQLADSSPYIEALAAHNVDVLFTYEENDEIVLARLAEFQKKKITSAENYLGKGEEKAEDDAEKATSGELSESDIDSLKSWIMTTIGEPKVCELRVSRRLESHPAMVTVQDMGAARHWLKFIKQSPNPEMADMKFQIIRPTLEINPGHDLIIALHKLKDSNPAIADLLLNQLYDNALVTAGLMDDAREMVGRLNILLTKVGTDLTVKPEQPAVEQEDEAN